MADEKRLDAAKGADQSTVEAGKEVPAQVTAPTHTFAWNDDPKPDGHGTDKVVDDLSVADESSAKAGSVPRDETHDAKSMVATTPPPPTRPVDPDRRAKRERRIAMLDEPAVGSTAFRAPDPTSERKSKSGWLAAALTLALVGWMASGMLGADEPTAAAVPTRTAEPEPVAVEVATSIARPIERALTIEGEVEPGLSTPVRAEAGGIIENVQARKGALIEAGAVIARIRPDERNAALAQARDSVAAAQAEFDRVDSLVARGFATRSRLEEARTGLSAAQSQLANAQAGFNDLTITAPASGALNALEIDPGEVVQPGAEVATIVDTSRLLIGIRVPQRAIADVTLGQTAEVAFVTGQRAEGRVTFVAANAESATRTFPVEIEVANPDRTIPSGISAEVRLPIEKIEAHFVSPAILSLGENGALGVKVVEADETVGFYPAELVRAETGGIWVSGLPDEATIITVGQGFVATGERVAAVAEGETPELPAIETAPDDATSPDAAAPDVAVIASAPTNVPGEGTGSNDVATSEAAVADSDASPTASSTTSALGSDTGIVVTTVPVAEATPESDAVPARVEIETVPVATSETDATATETEVASVPSDPPTEVPAGSATAAPAAPLDAPAPLDPAKVVTLAQERLAELNYDVGPATGRENPRTRVAVGRFQSDEGLPVSGDLTEATLARLGVDAEGTPRPDGALALDTTLSVAALQTALNDLGFDAGVADGILGGGTRAAIRAFQEANDLPITGQPSPELARALRAAGRVASNQ